MPKTRAQKEEQVVQLIEKLGRSKSVVFTDYQGMTMAQLSDLRNKLREVGAEFSVTKNNLLKLALKEAVSDQEPMSEALATAITINPSLFKGTIATLFAYDDEITPIKLLTNALKENAIGKVKAGIFEAEFIDEYKINKLASLPSKDELRAKIVGVLVAPLHGIVGVLQANLRNLVYTLEQIRVQRGGETT